MSVTYRARGVNWCLPDWPEFDSSWLQCFSDCIVVKAPVIICNKSQNGNTYTGNGPWNVSAQRCWSGIKDCGLSVSKACIQTNYEQFPPVWAIQSGKIWCKSIENVANGSTSAAPFSDAIWVTFGWYFRIQQPEVTFLHVGARVNRGQTASSSRISKSNQSSLIAVRSEGLLGGRSWNTVNFGERG